ncbi:carbohydrate kinase [Rhodopseudomonas palustris]|uniref:Carbohydrate kinase n=1 Tax=Thiospirillum jenense TaxID=1653858 RepID=A0A839HCR6_9GAMM|nr:PfkB family carbohydrate kinase [Thiospirillum jenense]MBB1089727.1 carbohydrate kinase [Rhodopseudomonas palustris]MBB1124829.1 carbohydrate kinase [Thiospirillum jenense]
MTNHSTFDPTPRIFGEVLFDCFATNSGAPPTCLLGGAPFNVAWHLHAFGQAPLFISRVGADDFGRDIIATMQAHQMTTSAVQQDRQHPSGRVAVTLDNGEPSYDIVAECAYDFIDAADLPAAPAHSLLYHGTLALRSAVSAAAWQHLCAEHQPARFVDVNLRAPWWQPAQVQALLTGARWIKLNVAELAQLAPAGTTLVERAQALLDQHGAACVIVTQGAAGACAISATAPPLSVSPPASVPVVDTVGAGDAFAAVFILGLMRHWPLPVTLNRAQQFAAAIVGQRGATVQDAAFYAAISRSWSTD